MGDAGEEALKAPRFEYLRATTLDEALALLAEHAGEAKLLAGGQSLVPAMNMRLAAPAVLIDVNGIATLAGVDVVDGRLRIGALTRHRELIESPEVTARAPLLARAARHIGHDAIRNRGTIGGSLAHADPAAELPACVLALSGVIVAASARGLRRIAAEDFFLGAYTTALEPDEMIVAVEVPPPQPGHRAAFQELCRRLGDYAMAGLAAFARRDGDELRDVRLAFFAVSDRPVLARAAAAAVEGRAVSPETVAAALRALAEDIDPMADLYNSAAMKAHLMRVLAGRALAELAG